jgi:hypothetical protein
VGAGVGCWWRTRSRAGETPKAYRVSVGQKGGRALTCRALLSIIGGGRDGVRCEATATAAGADRVEEEAKKLEGSIPTLVEEEDAVGRASCRGFNSVEALLLAVAALVGKWARKAAAFGGSTAAGEGGAMRSSLLTSSRTPTSCYGHMDGVSVSVSPCVVVILCREIRPQSPTFSSSSAQSPRVSRDNASSAVAPSHSSPLPAATAVNMHPSLAAETPPATCTCPAWEEEEALACKSSMRACCSRATAATLSNCCRTCERESQPTHPVM